MHHDDLQSKNFHGCIGAKKWRKSLMTAKSLQKGFGTTFRRKSSMKFSEWDISLIRLVSELSTNL